ncbi:MAG: hypothetical protein COW01_15860 [Bdellovibrionales bacterium CG12_big_fil_rev_8_21_14_0_65_38_15]|nr:MAG: hypothetical protein COW79_15025 [Bdellovibrionales bacterium CG22_combo_CG10-13_8_21_14_all_38_13]PIQ52444.1 MAG: hypothetical protein COW01_15860 [Bdellovibrionales bacterium CG12_big_fil_rev_8_21_14_0_65_38_15]PIR29482.1 MAG: hypothetical protein COV38_10400 [Bdellovibrionales bacterium CG11_big_fil_rev_8_21_14_0_20_38_13]
MSNKIEGSTFWKHPLTWGCLLAVGYWVYSYHLEHAMGILPYAILLLCPLMHIFMHHGHGHNHGNHEGHSGHSHEEHQNKDGGHNAR